MSPLCVAKAQHAGRARTFRRVLPRFDSLEKIAVLNGSHPNLAHLAKEAAADVARIDAADRDAVLADAQVSALGAEIQRDESQLTGSVGPQERTKIRSVLSSARRSLEQDRSRSREDQARARKLAKKLSVLDGVLASLGQPVPSPSPAPTPTPSPSGPPINAQAWRLTGVLGYLIEKADPGDPGNSSRIVQLLPAATSIWSQINEEGCQNVDHLLLVSAGLNDGGVAISAVAIDSAMNGKYPFVLTVNPDNPSAFTVSVTPSSALRNPVAESYVASSIADQLPGNPLTRSQLAPISQELTTWLQQQDPFGIYQLTVQSSSMVGTAYAISLTVDDLIWTRYFQIAIDPNNPGGARLTESAPMEDANTPILVGS